MFLLLIDLIKFQNHTFQSGIVSGFMQYERERLYIATFHGTRIAV